MKPWCGVDGRLCIDCLNYEPPLSIVPPLPVVPTLNLLPEVLWDRFAGDGIENVSVFGWIPRDDGRRDFVLVMIDEDGPWLFSTSSARYSAEFSARLKMDGNGHTACRRVEDHYPGVRCIQLEKENPLEKHLRTQEEAYHHMKQIRIAHDNHESAFPRHIDSDGYNTPMMHQRDGYNYAVGLAGPGTYCYEVQKEADGVIATLHTESGFPSDQDAKLAAEEWIARIARNSDPDDPKRT